MKYFALIYIMIIAYLILEAYFTKPIDDNLEI